MRTGATNFTLLSRIFIAFIALALAGCGPAARPLSVATPLATARPPTVSTPVPTATSSARAATPTAGVATPAPSAGASAMPPGWNPGASSAGLTLSVKPDHGGVGSGVRIEGSITPDLLSSQPIYVEFWPAGPHRSLGDRAHTKYTGPVWPSQWRVRPAPDGHFTLDVVKVPRVIQVASGDLWLIEPSAHDFALVIDPRHATFAPFHVDTPPPPPTTAPPPTVQFRHLWLAGAQIGWLTGARCQGPLPPTPDAYGNIPSPPPPRCQGLIDGTTDGGQTWTEQYTGDVQASQIQFVGAQAGWAIGVKGEQCEGGCPSALLRTTNGGGRWTEVYTTRLHLAALAFTSSADGWMLGQEPGGGGNPSGSTWHLLITSDGGRSWHDSTLPVKSSALSLAHPTTADGWAISSELGPGSERLIVTHDGAKSWQTLPDPVAPGFAFEQSLTFRASTQGWLLAGSQPGAGNQGKEVFATKDGGKSWTRLAWTGLMGQAGGSGSGGLPVGGYVGPIVSSSDRDVWIASARGSLLHSGDGGKTWAAAPIDAHYFVDVQFADARNGWALSIEGPGLWVTADGGLTWRRVPLPK